MNKVMRYSESKALLSVSTETDPITSKLLQFLNLPTGWHYGRGRPPVMSTVIYALGAVAKFRGLAAKNIEVFPDIEGEILIAAYSDEFCIDATILATGAINYVVEKNGVEVAQDSGASLGNLVAKIEAGHWLPCSSGSYTRNTTAKNAAGSRHQPSGTRTDPAFQWSMNAV